MEQHKEKLEAFKRLASDIDFIMTNYYPHYSYELDEKFEDLKYTLEAEIDRIKKEKLKKVI
jgi:hypothetical protein